MNETLIDLSMWLWKHVELQSNSSVTFRTLYDLYKDECYSLSEVPPGAAVLRASATWSAERLIAEGYNFGTAQG